jgi:G patch domain-containing protein 1
MTSRLKRKLNDMGIDPSSARANESFCLIGTPLPPLEKSKDTGEFVPLWKQEVRVLESTATSAL